MCDIWTEWGRVIYSVTISIRNYRCRTPWYDGGRRLAPLAPRSSLHSDTRTTVLNWNKRDSNHKHNHYNIIKKEDKVSKMYGIKVKGMAKIRLFYSGIMALILPLLKDIANFVLNLISSLFTLLINSVCLSVYDCHKFLESLGQNLSIEPYIGLISGVIFTPHTNWVNPTSVRLLSYQLLYGGVYTTPL